MAFKFGKLFHIIQVTDDYAPLDAWYGKHFGAIRYTDGVSGGFPYLAAEKRNASLTSFGDMCIEPISPAMEVEGWEQMPIGKFRNRFGANWYSIAWYMEDSLDLYRTLSEHGVRFAGLGGSMDLSADDAFFTHPKDTICAIEFMSRTAPSTSALPDPRYVDPDYDSIDWAQRSPLGFQSTAYITVMTRDLDRAKLVFGEWMKGEMLGESTSELTQTHDTYVKLGDTVLQLSVPLEEGSVVGKDHAARGDAVHAIAWKVADLTKAEQYLNAQGIKTIARDEHTIVTDPADTFGAQHRFTDTLVSEALS